MKSIFETLAVLGTGAILLTGCASNKVKAKEVPAASSKPAAAAPVETKTDAAAASTEPAKPEEKPADNAAATPATTATPAAAPKKVGTGKGKKPTAKKGGTDAACGEGTCG
jgi:hypothetical protein